MSSPSWIARTGGFAPRLAQYYAAYFVGLGVQLPFFPVWLAAKGLEPEMIGLVLAAPMLIRVIAVPVMTREADRHDALRAAIIIGSAATCLGYGLVGLVDSAIAILAIFSLFALVFTPTMPLVDAYALRGLARYGGAYGSIRLWGSASFIVGSFGAGLLLHAMTPQNLIWLIAGGYGLTAVIALGLAPISSGEPRSAGSLRSGTLLRSPVFLAVIGSASLIQASHALLYGFATIAWEAAGLSTITIGALSALAVAAEIVLFAVARRLPASFGPTMLLILGAAGAVLRWIVMAFDPPALLLPALQCLHALSFAATHLGAMGFLNRAAPPGLAATAQGYYAIVTGVSMSIATASSGLLYATYGNAGYAVMALIAAAGGALAVYAHRRWNDPDRTM
ncbi:MAG: MFS transporter [Rhizobiales bacterium]|nr:MFS transporter [Hyphomicrobiales bacterium]